MQFPDGFTWGVSTASFQIEGAVNEDGRGESIWDRFSHTPGRILHGDTADVACDHYHRLDQDLDLLQELGVQVYRFSLAWPRIQPSGRGEPLREGIAFYNRLIDGLLARSIQPVPTLYHWDLPQALEDEGGWANRSVVDAFADYAAIAFAAFGDRGRDMDNHSTSRGWWPTSAIVSRIHAPGIVDPAKAARAHHHLFAGSCRSGGALPVWRRCGGGGDRAQSHAGVSRHQMILADVAAAALADAQLNRSFLGPLFEGAYPPELTGDRGFLGCRARHCPCLAILSGSSARPISFRSTTTIRAIFARRSGWPKRRWPDLMIGPRAPMPLGLPMVDLQPANTRKTLIGWINRTPSGLRDLLVRLGRDYPSVPLYISEKRQRLFPTIWTIPAR